MNRTNIGGRAQIIQGDMTSHGGVVISGSATNNWYGSPIARKGDQVTCPKCAPHIFEIAEGVDNCKDGGKPRAVEGNLTTCGAVLIAKTASVKYGIESSGFNDKYILKDNQGNILPDMYYAVQFPDGDIEYGTSSATGETHLYATGEQSKDLKFYIVG